MSEEKPTSNNSFQVRDRRRFDSDGNERSLEKEEPPASAKAGASASGPSSTAKPSGAPGPDMFSSAANGYHPGEQEISFSSFVMSLATQALVQLGQMEGPPGMELPFDPEAAMQTIEILTMLQGKTNGNLSDVESKLLEDILHNLRVVYVQRVRGDGAGNS
jgi:hypothetical protein